MNRIFDIFFSFMGILILSPFLLTFSILIWLNDFHSPLYIAKRVGKKKRIFKIIKLRTMIKDADKNKVDSTSSDDKRITKLGSIIRKFKLDEFTQLWNVLIGNMSLVGPRPNVIREVDLYTDLEMHLLKVKPGITDFASIVFADEGDILKNSSNPDIDYNQLIRPGKNKLGLFYINKKSIFLDTCIILLTITAIFNRQKALKLLVRLLRLLGASEELQKISSRKFKLVPSPPPGAINIVTSREK